MNQEEASCVLSVRPGITSQATLNFRNEEELLAPLSLERVEEVYMKAIMPLKLRMDLEYLETASFTSDLRIIAETVVRVFIRQEQQNDLLIKKYLAVVKEKEYRSVQEQREYVPVVEEADWGHGLTCWSGVFFLLKPHPENRKIQFNQLDIPPAGSDSVIAPISSSGRSGCHTGRNRKQDASIFPGAKIIPNRIESDFLVQGSNRVFLPGPQ